MSIALDQAVVKIMPIDGMKFQNFVRTGIGRGKVLCLEDSK